MLLPYVAFLSGYFYQSSVGKQPRQKTDVKKQGYYCDGAENVVLRTFELVYERIVEEWIS